MPLWESLDYIMDTYHHRRPHRQSSWLILLLIAYLACFAHLQPIGATVSGIGTITTVVGTGVGGYSGDGGSATLAQIGSVLTGRALTVRVDSVGNLYILDTPNFRVRRVDKATGNISTVAGNGTAGYSGDGGSAILAQISSGSSGIALDSADNLYIADTNNYRIRRVDKATGNISTVAGNGTTGFSGDGGSAILAQISSSYGIALDSADNLYIADVNNQRIRRVDKGTGNISTVVGTGIAGFSGDGGSATLAQINTIAGITFDNADNFYIADRNNYRIRRVDKVTGNISTVAGNGTTGFSGDGGSAILAQMTTPYDIAFDSLGNLYLADMNNQRIRRVDKATGNISTVVGTGVAGFSGDGSQAMNAQLNLPNSIAFDATGNLYILDSNNKRVRSIAPGPVPPTISSVVNQIIPMNRVLTALPLTVGDLDTPVSSLTLSAASSNPALVPVANISFGGSGANRTVTITPTTGLTGTAVLTLTVSDGGLSTSTSFTLTVSDIPNITTVTGTGVAGSSGGGGLATVAQIDDPHGITTDRVGNLYIADENNHLVRRVDRTTGVITTVAGTGAAGYNGDGILATIAQLYWPRDLAFDSDGNLYIADESNHRIRRVDAVTGLISTVVGTGTAGITATTSLPPPPRSTPPEILPSIVQVISTSLMAMVIVFGG